MTKNKKIKICPTAYLNEAFESIPTNSIINKGRCGIGGTTMELSDNRNSIIVVPNVSIIQNKTNEYPNLYAVYGQISIPELEHGLGMLLTQPNFKIMSTPDSFYKIMEASKNLSFDIYNNCFLLFDECHSVITEGLYRENITSPFRYFFDFKDKSLISATPYPFSDPRFNNLERIDITFTKPLDIAVEVVFTDSTTGLLKHYLKQEIDKDGGNIHVFFNTVEHLPAILEGISLNKVSIFCADNSKNRNSLGDYAHLLSDVESGNQRYKKLNIYTTKYYEGWDLVDEEATLIFATDVSAPHTCQNITIKAVQALGRARLKPKQIFHITNTHDYQSNPEQMNTNFTYERTKHAEETVTVYNYIQENCHFTYPEVQEGFSSALNPVVNQYADISNTTGLAKINYCKIDSLANHDAANEQYLNKQSILDAWGQTNFTVTYSTIDYDFKYECCKMARKNRLGKQKLFEHIITRLQSQSEHQQAAASSNRQGRAGTLFYFEPSEITELKEIYPEYVKFYETLGFDKIADLKFNIRQVKQAYIEKNKSRFEVSFDVAKLLYLRISPNRFYPSMELKSTFEDIYKILGITLTPKATQIEKYYLSESTRKNIGGSTVRGYFLRQPKLLIK